MDNMPMVKPSRCRMCEAKDARFAAKDREIARLRAALEQAKNHAHSASFGAYCGPLTRECMKSIGDSARQAWSICDAALASPAPCTAPTVACANCGKLVHTCERCAAHSDGAEFSDGRWACSTECWDALVSPAPATAPDPLAAITGPDGRGMATGVNTPEPEPKKIQTAEQWAEEGQRKYGSGAAAWLKRWKVNCRNHPEDLVELDRAIAILTQRAAERRVVEAAQSQDFEVDDANLSGVLVNPEWWKRLQAALSALPAPAQEGKR